MAKLESLLQFIDEHFHVSVFPDYPHALNGLQVEGPEEVEKLVAAVDASERTIEMAAEAGADLLLVHHGLFWDGFGPMTGPRYRKVKALIEGGMALYALHLPLDAHKELGNSALLCRALGWEAKGPFGEYKGEAIGVWAEARRSREEIRKTLGEVVGGEIRLIPGGPEEVGRAGVLTGSGASALREAAALGLDGLITGEAAHHNYHDAMELGINLFLAGHYATETFGVKALAAHLAEVFGVEWRFLDLPTGL